MRLYQDYFREADRILYIYPVCGQFSVKLEQAPDIIRLAQSTVIHLVCTRCSDIKLEVAREVHATFPLSTTLFTENNPQLLLDVPRGEGQHGRTVWHFISPVRSIVYLNTMEISRSLGTRHMFWQFPSFSLADTHERG